jgi:predicted transcriptional regulator
MTYDPRGHVSREAGRRPHLKAGYCRASFGELLRLLVAQVRHRGPVIRNPLESDFGRPLLSRSWRDRAIFLITRLLEQAVETVSAPPDDVQDQLASILLQLAGVEQPPIPLTMEEEADLDASPAEAERGEFATNEEVRPIWAKYGR